MVTMKSLFNLPILTTTTRPYVLMCPGIRCLTLKDLLYIDYRKPLTWFATALASSIMKYRELYVEEPGSMLLHPKLVSDLLRTEMFRPGDTLVQHKLSGILSIFDIIVIQNHTLVQQNEFILCSDANGLS